MMRAYKINVILAAALLVGCGALEQRREIHQNSADEAKEVLDRKSELDQADIINSASVREINGVWLGSRTVKVSSDAQLPDIFSKNIIYRFSDSPSLQVIADRIGKITNISVNVAYDALVSMDELQQLMNSGSKNTNSNPMPMMPPGMMAGGMPMPVPNGAIGSMPNMHNVATGRAFILDMSSPYKGTLKEFLDQITSRYGVGWDYKDGKIIISRLVTRTYDIASLIDVNETKTAIIKNSGSSTTSSGASGDSAGQVSESTSSSEVSSTVESKLDVIEGLKTAISSALTPTVGKYSISPFGVISVTDTREVQEKIRSLVDAENNAISRQVRLRFVMVELEASTKNDTGFDISAALAKASQKWKIDFATPGGMLGGGGTSAGQIGILRDGNGGTTQAFIKAMSEVGRVNLRRDETYTLMNNRPLSVAQVDNFIYPARSTPGYAATGGTGAGTAGVEPGQLTTGNFLNLRASIMPNGSVIVNFNLDASRRGKTETYSSNGAVLQYPQSNGANYQTYASIPNGQTGVIAALDLTQGEATDRSLDSTISPLLGGGIYNNKVRRLVMVLITPHIIEGAI